MSKQHKKIAIFDIDGTVFRSSLLVELVDELISRGLFPKDALKVFHAEKVAWKNRKGSYEAYITAVISAFEQHIKGLDYSTFNEVAKILVAAKKDELYRFTRDLIAELKRKQYYLLAVSQSPKSILELLCRRLGFDKVYGRIYEIGPTDRFTGVITDIHLIANKSNIVRRVLLKEGFDLRGSIGVGDTEGDISFLELVERPICFNPNLGLYKHARRNKWEVVVERKDVVYEIQ